MDNLDDISTTTSKAALKLSLCFPDVMCFEHHIVYCAL
jgi:hypothetical protein